MPKERPFRKVIYTANALRSGEVVYLHLDEEGQARWKPTLEGIWLIESPEALEKADSIARTSEEQRLVVSAEAVEANDNARPRHIRELIRATGPTIAYLPQPKQETARV